ncbi:hypothetical protein [Virgibacillus proomii]|uniref:hypothetical protein n=1 Tax=Virgibacillus proomii TaxID=84407 RepID=UPI001C0F6E16|nr:hypothetical protein [Virgibacillus proomii]MBU5267545.1 hypothetical protein [Virgibacillus proomii]
MAIAATQIIEPPIFVMDEPSANLDLPATQMLYQQGSEDVVLRLLQEFDLWHLKDHHPATLSGGEKQRLFLSISLMQKALS